MRSSQWLPRSGCQETTEDSNEGEDNRDNNSDKNTVDVHSHSSERAPSPLSALIVLL